MEVIFAAEELLRTIEEHSVASRVSNTVIRNLLVIEEKNIILN